MDPEKHVKLVNGWHMKNTAMQAVPVPTLRRLPTYLQVLKRLQSTGRDVVSCTHIAQELHLDPTQVRKDLAATGVVGKPRVGYYLPTLIDAIEDFLGWNNTKDAFLVGVGSLGTALLKYEGFREHGLNILAAFDANPEKIGTEVAGVQVLDIKKLPELASRMHIHIGVVTVPTEAAQQVVDELVAGGVMAIWNFAPANVEVPEGIIVEHVRLASSLAVLSSQVAAALRAAEA